MRAVTARKVLQAVNREPSTLDQHRGRVACRRRRSPGHSVPCTRKVFDGPFVTFPLLVTRATCSYPQGVWGTCRHGRKRCSMAACRQHGTGRAATLQLLRKVAVIVLPNQKLTAVLIADNPGSSVITASTWKPG
jgi:hypothetical protein